MHHRRAHPRLRERDSVAVTVLKAPEAKQIENQTFFCSTHDLSAGGLRLLLHVVVPVDAALELRVAFTRPIRSFIHIGKVAWVKRVDQEQPYAIGVKFTDTPADVLASWSELVARKLAHRGMPDNDEPEAVT